MKSNVASINLFFILFSITLVAQEFPKDFRGIEFGSKFLSNNTTKFIYLSSYDYDDYKTYIRAGDKKYIGDIALDSVLYAFHSGQFEHVDLVLNSSSNWVKLMKVFVDKYGVPKRTHKNLMGDIEFVEWVFEEGTINGHNYKSNKLPRNYWFEIESKFAKDNSTNPNPKIDYSKDF